MKKRFAFLSLVAASLIAVSCGGGGSGTGGVGGLYSTDPDKVLGNLSDKMFLNNMAFNTMSNILKTQHDTSMAIIHNMNNGWDLDYNYRYTSSASKDDLYDSLKTFPSFKDFQTYKKQVSNTISCDSGSATATLDWSNDNCDLTTQNPDKEQCFKNNNISLDVTFNQCYEQNENITVDGDNKLTIQYPTNPKTNSKGSYLPSNIGFEATDLSYKETSSTTYIKSLDIDLNLDNAKVSMKITMYKKENGTKKFETKDLTFKHHTINSNSYSYSIDGLVYDGDKSEWTKFDTKKDFVDEKIGSKTCTTQGKLIINDVVTVEAKQDSSGNYIFEATATNGQSKTISACN